MGWNLEHAISWPCSPTSQGRQILRFHYCMINDSSIKYQIHIFIKININNNSL